MVGNKTINRPEDLARDWQWTKVLFSDSPLINDYSSARAIINEGINGVILESPIINQDGLSKHIGWYRQAAKELDTRISIIQELSGPELLIGDFKGVIEVTKGQVIQFVYRPTSLSDGQIPLKCNLVNYVKRGEKIELFNGRVSCVVSSIKEQVIFAEVLNDGILIQGKPISLPETDLQAEFISDQDRRDLVYGSTQDIDYVCIGNVRTVNDIERLRHLLSGMNYQAKIIVRIETHQALKNLEDVFSSCDAVIASYDQLSQLIRPEKAALVIARLSTLSQNLAKPMIVSVQPQSGSATNKSIISDIARDLVDSVRYRVDGLWLKLETPNNINQIISSISAVFKIIRISECEKLTWYQAKTNLTNQSVLSQTTILNAVGDLATKLQAKGIVNESRIGLAILDVASLRSDIPLLGVTSDQRRANQLAIIWGVRPFVRSGDQLNDVELFDWLRSTQLFSSGDLVVLAVGESRGELGTIDTFKIRVME